MANYNTLQVNYIRSFAKLMSIKDEEEAVLEWIDLGLAVKFSEVYRPRYMKTATKLKYRDS